MGFSRPEARGAIRPTRSRSSADVRASSVLKSWGSAARGPPPPAGDQGGLRIELESGGAALHRRRRRKCSPTWRAPIDYEKTPLDARIEETIETPEWKREKITFSGANGARAIAYLYLPHHVPRPLQVIHYYTGRRCRQLDFDRCRTSMDESMAPYVRAGRAAFGVVLEGYIERLRPAGFASAGVTR